nr:hypothetical protein [uncultured Rhodopila sp.]
MYRCYLIRNGRIALGDDVDVDTLASALAHGRRLIASRSAGGMFNGMEIWSGATLVYSDTGYAGESAAPAAVVSPFQTAESTILPNWRPSLARPILAMRKGIGALADALSIIDGDARLPEAEAANPTFARRLRKSVRRRSARGPMAA